jgi:hypothetical protein
MRSEAGRSAREEYRAARTARRHRAIVVSGLLGVAAAAGYAAVAGITMAAAASVVCLVCLVSMAAAWRRRPRGDPERWLRGAAGEEATARLLARLPVRRWVVRHDLRIPGSRANLDHLVIGPSGVWVVDTKTTRAEVRARWGTVRFGGRRLDPDPTRWEAEMVADRLGVPVRALIAVHGRGLRRRGGRCGGVRVVPAARLTRRLRRGRPRLAPADVAELARRAERAFAPAARNLEKGVASGG